MQSVSARLVLGGGWLLYTLEKGEKKMSAKGDALGYFEELMDALSDDMRGA